MNNMDNFSVQDHNRYMKIALNLAIKGRGRVSPNPIAFKTLPPIEINIPFFC